MRRFVVALLSATAMSAVGANAADLPVKAPPVPFVAAYNWSGIYVGGFIGGLWGQKEWTFLNGNTTSHTADGFFGGGQIGFNWQISNWVLGAQADFGWTNASGSSSCPNAAFTCKTSIKHLGSLTGRVGYAFNEWLPYIKGGGAWTKDDYEASGPSLFTGSNSPWGWTVGAGLEWGFLPNWSTFIEYDYYDFGTNRITFSNAAGVTDDFDSKQQVHVVKVGVNYRFTLP